MSTKIIRRVVFRKSCQIPTLGPNFEAGPREWKRCKGIGASALRRDGNRGIAGGAFRYMGEDLNRPVAVMTQIEVER